MISPGRKGSLIGQGRRVADPGHGVYAAASALDREELLDLLRAVFPSSAGYRTITCTAQGGTGSMVSLHLAGSPRADGSDLRSDVMDKLNRQVFESRRCLHALADTADGFEVRFAILHAEGDFLTGLIAVRSESPHQSPS